MIALVAILALAVDVGYIAVVDTQLQRAADAGALAGAAALYGDAATEWQSVEYYGAPDIKTARNQAHDFVKANGSGKYRPAEASGHLHVHRNDSNNPDDDVVVGRLYNPKNLSEPLTPTTEHPNTVFVRVSLTDANSNGGVSMFFGRALGIPNVDVTATATATAEYPTLLPIATSLTKWESLNTGGDGDNYAYQPGNITAGFGEGNPEIDIFPDQNWKDTDGMPPGNFGLLTIGPVAGTEVLRRQIDMGPSTSELGYHGGSLYAGMTLFGKTGVSGDIRTALYGGDADLREYPGILGKVKLLPLYDNVTGNGSEATFTIVKFVAVRIMDAQLTGNPKKIVIQEVTLDENLLNVYLSR